MKKELKNTVIGVRVTLSLVALGAVSAAVWLAMQYPQTALLALLVGGLVRGLALYEAHILARLRALRRLKNQKL